MTSGCAVGAFRTYWPEPGLPVRAGAGAALAADPAATVQVSRRAAVVAMTGRVLVMPGALHTSPATLQRVERAAGELSSGATRRMEGAHDWYRALSAEDRSWVGL